MFSQKKRKGAGTRLDTDTRLDVIQPPSQLLAEIRTYSLSDFSSCLKNYGCFLPVPRPSVQFWQGRNKDKI